MEDIVDVESELTQRLSGLQKRLEKVAHPDLSNRGDLNKVHELIKANLQRSKVIQDQINESKVWINFYCTVIEMGTAGKRSVLFCGKNHVLCCLFFQQHALELFEHKGKVTEIVNKYVSKRQLKKRDVK